MSESDQVAYRKFCAFVRRINDGQEEATSNLPPAQADAFRLVEPDPHEFAVWWGSLTAIRREEWKTRLQSSRCDQELAMIRFTLDRVFSEVVARLPAA